MPRSLRVRRLAASAIASALTGATLFATQQPVDAGGSTLQISAVHAGSLFQSALITWFIIVRNQGPGPTSGFSASGNVAGAALQNLVCPDSTWGGSVIVSDSFLCGSGNGYRLSLGVGQATTFTITARIVTPPRGSVRVTVTGRSTAGDTFAPAMVTDVGQVLPGGPGVQPTTSPSPGSAGTGAAAAATAPAASGLLLALAFVVSAAGMFLLFVRRRGRMQGPAP